MIGWGSYVRSILPGFRSPFALPRFLSANRHPLKPTTTKKPGSLASPGLIRRPLRLLRRDEVGFGQHGLADFTAQGLHLGWRDGRSGVAEAIADVRQDGGDLFVGLMR